MNRIQKVLLLCLAYISVSSAVTLWQTTHNGSSSGYCQLTSNTISIDLHPFYADVVEEAEIAPLGTVWSGDSSSLEITGTFTLTAGSAIRSMLLWNGTKILKAKLRLSADADSLYENVVNRQVVRDPAIITYTGNNTYSFKIYPAQINTARKIRILYTVPLKTTVNGPQLSILTAFTIGAQTIPTQVPITIQSPTTDTTTYILQYSQVKKTVMRGSTYMIPTASLEPLTIVAANTLKNFWYTTHIDTGNLTGYYSAIYVSRPDTISKIITEQVLTESLLTLESAISANGKTYLSDLPGSNYFTTYIKSSTPWDSIITWTGYDKETGAIKLSYVQKFLPQNDSIDLQRLPLLWAAKYSVSNSSGTLGAYYGFVDTKMSLLALEADTLPQSIATLYTDSGVPVLATNEIIYDTTQIAILPEENIIIENPTSITTPFTSEQAFRFEFAKGMLSLTFEKSFTGEFKVILVDARGRIVKSFDNNKLSGLSAHFKLPANLKGVFFVHVIAGKEHISKKLILN